METQFRGNTQFSPQRDIPSLEGKVIFITGGTTGLGAESIKALADHDPEHIYFTGRNTSAADVLIKQIQAQKPDVPLTFVEMDMASLDSVKNAVQQGFKHDKLHILMCNAGIMAAPAELTKDGIERQFAVNHVAHALVIRQLRPAMLKAAEEPDSDVRLISLSSLAWKSHPKDGIVFDKLRTTQESLLGGSWLRYGQSKLANIVYAAEFARRNPSITTVSLHPGIVGTDLLNKQSPIKKVLLLIANLAMGTTNLTPEQGAFAQLWAAAGAKKGELVNGAFYMPIGVESNNVLDKSAKDPAVAKRLWEWTEEALAKY